MRSKEEINEKLEKLEDTIKGIKESDETLSNEMKVLLSGSELQAIMIKSVLGKGEEDLRKLLAMFEERGKKLNKDYAISSKNEDIENKTKFHAMVWTNDIRIDSLKWILNED